VGVTTPDDASPADVASIGHDEDGDGIGDGVDLCPHVAGDDADVDSDGVGDGCDPDPVLAGNRIRLFSTLTAGDHPFNMLGALVQEPDGLRYTGDSLGLIIPTPFANARFELGFEILGQVGTGQHQIASGVVGTNPYYFVELNENLGVMNVAITSYDPTNGYVNHALVQTLGTHPGVGILGYDASTAPAGIRAMVGWVGELYNAQALAPGYTGGNEVNIVINGLDVVLRYVVIIDRP
jgi:hypothetical protein